MAAQVYDYLQNRFICIQTCDGAGENDIATNDQAGEMGFQLNVCCSETPCNYVFDYETGMLFPVLCDT